MSELRLLLEDEFVALEESMRTLQREATDFWYCHEPLLSIWAQLPLEHPIPRPPGGSIGERELYYQLMSVVKPSLESRRYGFETVPVLQPHLAHYGGPPFGTRYLAAVMGAQVRFPKSLPKSKRTGWFASVDPIVGTESDIDALEDLDVSESPVVQAVMRGYQDIRQIVRGRIPFVLYGSVSSLDVAADLVGHLRFYEMLAAEPEMAARLIRICTQKCIDLLRIYDRVIEGHWVNYFYEPGLRMGEMITSFISPQHVRQYLLPAYREASEEFGGVFIDIRHPDHSLLDDYLAVPGLRGLSVPMEWPSEPVLAAVEGRMALKLTLNWHYHRGKEPASPVCYAWDECCRRFAEFAGRVRIHVDLSAWGETHREKMECLLGDLADLKRLWQAAGTSGPQVAEPKHATDRENAAADADR